MKIKNEQPRIWEQYLNETGSKMWLEKSTQKSDPAKETRKIKEARQTPNHLIHKPNQRFTNQINKQTYEFPSGVAKLLRR